MKILWLNINSSYSHTSLSIPALHAQLWESVESDIEWRVISGTINRDISLYISEILEFNPHLILSTAWLFNHNYLYSLLVRSKALLKDTSIILGGPEFLGDNYEYLSQNSFIDAVFRGEGEEVFPLFVDRFVKGMDWFSLPGFCHIDKNGGYVDNGVAEVKDFSALKIPESSSFFEWDRPFVQIETSRGCFNRCTFCISGNDRKIDNIPASSLRERLNKVREKGIKEVRILDRTFNANPKRAILLLTLFAEYSPDIKFHLEIHPSLLDKEIKESLVNLPPDLLHIEAGMQSLDNNVISECNRSGDSDSSLEGLNYLVHSTSFEIHTDLISGLPFYTLKRLKADVRKLVLLNPEEIQLESLKLLPGTKLRENASKYGICFSPLPPYEVLQTNHISFEELKNADTLSKILEIFYNGKILKESFVKLCNDNEIFLDLLIEYYDSSIFDYNSGAEKKAMLLWDFCHKNFKNSQVYIIKEWICNGYSHNKGPGKLLRIWKFGDKIVNPVFKSESKDYYYKFLDLDKKRFWFIFNKTINSYKPISNFIEIL
ncbi:MAG: hypothetical protein A2X19_04365 [Bacteroidetes bacterium GWE2_39_28]|nr:MAG: hypothetical protein A2X19_04365 [Bacteroidetes bacterium GWE2_39_28]OFY14103.1 MAG: hypothetical protein A2X16_04345 [Bacteroidetes bacterium GWF2_39_10]OFZ10888.1 MAG: hypothetical protein A2465_09950 [Bacteroidetes bacterium RIFOXYC2_FULL_39_11]HCT94046.1 B12-binding domain-containing radical SAM protein [Rikenellaceae bacterium]